MKTDFSACILTGEAALRERLENIAGSYSPESGCCVMCCLAVGEGAEIDCRISRGSVTPPENCFETGVITSCGIKYHYSIGGRSAD